MLPYGRQCIEDDDIAAVADVLRGDLLTTGPAVDAFEKKFCEITRAKHSVVCSNGTTALHLAALALDLGPGDAVIVPTLTFLATANCIRYVGAHVIFADVDLETGLMGVKQFEDAVARCPDALALKAVFPVHLAGQCVDMPGIVSRARGLGLKIVTDSCHALGTKHISASGARVPAGSCTDEDMAVFSFHPVKTIAMGEGGAVTTNDEDMAQRMKILRTHGMVHRPVKPHIPEQGLDAHGQPNPWYYEMPQLGYNYRASDIHCALGLSQLSKLDRFIQRRKEIAAYYDHLLEPLAPVIRPPARVQGCDPAWHLYAVRIDFSALGMERAALMNRLRAEGIGTQVHYLPVHRQPYYRALYGVRELSGADHYYEHTLSLPLYPDLEDKDVERVTSALKSLL